MFRKTTLKNGLRIVAMPDKRIKAVTVLVLVATGSKYEKKETNGISHLLEHMLFKGTKSKPAPLDIVEPLDRVGGVYNAFTAEEVTGYYAKVDSSHFDLALDTISDIYLNSKLDPKEIKKEKGVIIEEINMYQDHPSSYVQILWSKLLYGDQPAGWSIAGTKESVLGIPRQQVLNYMKSQYVAPNTVVCLAGDIPAKFEAKINKHFSRINTKKGFDKSPVVERQTRPECLIFQKKTDQTHFCLGARAYNLFAPQRYAQEVLSAILGGMMSSRLFVKIREEMGLCYYIRSSSFSDTDAGSLVTQTGVDNGKAEKAVSAILKEYKKIAQRSIPLGELKKGKDNLKGKLALLLETSDAQASFYGLQEILEKKVLKPEEIYDRINKVSGRDVSKLAQEIFKPEKLNLALIGPFKDKSKFQKLLRI